MVPTITSRRFAAFIRCEWDQAWLLYRPHTQSLFGLSIHRRGMGMLNALMLKAY